MATFSEKTIRNHRQDAQGIGPTTVFSGADIDVIAYRGDKTPAEKFTIDALDKEIKKADDYNSAQRKAIIAKEKQIASTEAQVQQSRENIKRYSTILPEGSSASGRLADKEGKFQNRRRQQQEELLQLQSNLTIGETAQGLLEEDRKAIVGSDTDIFFNL